MSCCTLGVFMEDYHYYFAKQMQSAPTEAQLKRARSDWRAGSTGWEGVQIAKELIAIAAQKAAEKPLLNIGGNNYAHQGSELAIKFGIAQEPKQ